MELALHACSQPALRSKGPTAKAHIDGVGKLPFSSLRWQPSVKPFAHRCIGVVDWKAKLSNRITDQRGNGLHQRGAPKASLPLYSKRLFEGTGRILLSPPVVVELGPKSSPASGMEDPGRGRTPPGGAIGFFSIRPPSELPFRCPQGLAHR